MTNVNSKVRATEQEVKEFLEHPDIVDGAFKRVKGEKLKLIEPDKLFLERPLQEQNDYWHKLASSLNKVAIKIQDERDALDIILFEKEKLLKACQAQRNQDRVMIQKQLINANGRHQKLLEENQKLYKRITELEKEGGN